MSVGHPSHGLGAYVDWTTRRATRKYGKPPAEGTVSTRRSRIRVAEDLVGRAGTSLADCLTARAGCEQLLDILYAHHSAATVRADVAALCDYGDYLVARGDISQHCLTSADIPKTTKRTEVGTYSQAEIERLLIFAEARNQQLWLLLLFVYETGSRITEALNVKFDDFHFDHEPAYVALRITKGDKPRKVPLSTRLQTTLSAERLAWLQARRRRFGKDDAYLWLKSYNAAYVTLQTVCDAAGIQCHGWHILRHTRATSLLASGAPLHAVASVLGHASVRTTEMFYDHTTPLDFAAWLDYRRYLD